MKLNPKGVNNSYLEKHLMGKGISTELILKTLEEGQEVEEKRPKLGSRYFCLEMPHGAGLPGRFVLPDLDGPLGGKVANLNMPVRYAVRHGKLASVVARRNLPAWLIDFASVVYVIIERNQLDDGRLQLADGPTECDPEGSWMVATAHFGPPSRQRPRVPKDCSDVAALKNYLEECLAYEVELTRTIFVDLEADGQFGPDDRPLGEAADEIAELHKVVAQLREDVLSLTKKDKRQR